MPLPYFDSISIQITPSTSYFIHRDLKAHSIEMTAPSLNLFNDPLPRELGDPTVRKSLTTLRMEIPNIPNLVIPNGMPLLPNLKTIVMCLGGTRYQRQFDLITNHCGTGGGGFQRNQKDNANSEDDEKAVECIIPFLLSFKRSWNSDTVQVRSHRFPAVPDQILLRLFKPAIFSTTHEKMLTLWAHQLIRLRLDLKCHAGNPQRFDEVEVLLWECAGLEELVLMVDEGALDFKVKVNADVEGDKKKIVYLPALKNLNLITTTTDMMDELLSRLRVHNLSSLFLQFQQPIESWSPRPSQLLSVSAGGKITSLSLGRISNIVENDELRETMKNLDELHLLTCNLPSWLFDPTYPLILHIRRVELGNHKAFTEPEISMLLTVLEIRMSVNAINTPMMSIAMDTRRHLHKTSQGLQYRYLQLLLNMMRYKGRVRIMPMFEQEVEPPVLEELSRDEVAELFDSQVERWLDGWTVRPC